LVIFAGALLAGAPQAAKTIAAAAVKTKVVILFISLSPIEKYETKTQKPEGFSNSQKPIERSSSRPNWV